MAVPEERALSSKVSPLRGVLEMHRLHGHPREQVTRDKAKQFGAVRSAEAVRRVLQSKGSSERRAKVSRNLFRSQGRTLLREPGRQHAHDESRWES